MRYLVKLVNGEVFEGERKWYYNFYEPSRVYRFTNVVFRAGEETNLHSQHQLEKIFIPEHSVVYMEPIRG